MSASLPYCTRQRSQERSARPYTFFFVDAVAYSMTERQTWPMSHTAQSNTWHHSLPAWLAGVAAIVMNVTPEVHIYLQTAAGC